MSNYAIWFNPKSYGQTALVVGNGVAYVGSPRKGQLDRIRELMEAQQSPLPLLGEKAIVLTQETIWRITAELPPPSLRIHYKRDKESKFVDVDFTDEAGIQDALGALERELQLTRTSKQLTTFSAAIKPVAYLLIWLGVVWFLSVAATEAQERNPPEIRGRHGLVKALFVLVLHYLGPMGVYVIGGLVGLLMLRWIYKRVMMPPLVVTLNVS